MDGYFFFVLREFLNDVNEIMILKDVYFCIKYKVIVYFFELFKNLKMFFLNI